MGGFTIKDRCEGRNGCTIDHLGNYYTDMRSMCNMWGVNYSTFSARLMAGWDLKKALTYNNDKTVPDKDTGVVWLFGEPFPSYTIVDEMYGFGYGVSTRHKDNLEEWIMSFNRFYLDGKLYRTVTELSLEYGVSDNTISTRLSQGWSLYDAVHRPIDSRGRKGIVCQDHLGNEYESVSEMIRKYGITYAAYTSRKRRGWSLERILTEPIRPKLRKKPCAEN